MSPKITLQELKPENIPHLLKVLEKLLPDSVVVYTWIVNHLKWIEKIPELKVTLLCPDGDWTNGTVVTLADGLAVPSRIYGTVYAQEKDLEILKAGLTDTNLINWDRMKHFSAMPERCIPVLKEVLKSKKSKQFEIYEVQCHLNYIPPEIAQTCPLPIQFNSICFIRQNEGVRVGPLDASHLDIVCDNWMHYDPEYRPVVLKMIKLNPSVGVFVKNENGEEELVSMVMQSEYGGVGLLQTVPEHRRKGYAEVALAYLTRALGKIGVIPHGHIMTWNTGSAVLFEKLGYEKNGVSVWFCIKKITDI